MSIQSIHRAFEILQAINNLTEPARAVDIAEQIDLPRTTVIRILGTLEEVGAVVRFNESKNGSRQYQIGQTARILGQSKTGSLKEIARPDLEWLAAESEETAYLCKQAGDRVYYLDQINSQYHIQLQSWIGKSFAIHTTAPGKIFVAWLPDAELDRYLSQPLQTLTEKTVTDPNQIRAYAKEIRARGFAWTHEQTEAGLIGIAAPIVKGDSELIGAVSLAGPAFRFPKPKQEQSLEKLIVEVGRRISANL